MHFFFIRIGIEIFMICKYFSKRTSASSIILNPASNSKIDKILRENYFNLLRFVSFHLKQSHVWAKNYKFVLQTITFLFDVSVVCQIH
jgi:hypothetical protein